MSQISERTNIISIDEVPLVQEIHASMVNLNDLISYEPLNNTLLDMNTFCPQNILSAINSTVSHLNIESSSTSVCSPNSLRSVFNNSFSSTINKMQANGLSITDAKKASLLSTLSTMKFKVIDRQTIINGVKAAMNAKDESALNTEIKTVMNNLEVSHTKVFSVALAKACAAASIKVGFKYVDIKSVNGKLEVIARTKEGKKLVSEITVDSRTNSVDCNTETIGITDNSCSAIIQQFNEELKRLGIKIGTEKTTFTGGNCRMPYSKIIDQNDKEQIRKKKEQDRMKKLNINKYKI